MLNFQLRPLTEDASFCFQSYPASRTKVEVRELGASLETSSVSQMLRPSSQCVLSINQPSCVYSTYFFKSPCFLHGILYSTVINRKT